MLRNYQTFTSDVKCMIGTGCCYSAWSTCSVQASTNCTEILSHQQETVDRDFDMQSLKLLTSWLERY